MTRTELHELVDIVMDARERTGINLTFSIDDHIRFTDWSSKNGLILYVSDCDSLSDFTQAVNKYIKTLEK